MKAFPMIVHMDGKLQGDLGMDLRDYFAAMAMQSYFTPNAMVAALESVGEPASKCAKACYEVADAMMKARAK